VLNRCSVKVFSNLSLLKFFFLDSRRLPHLACVSKDPLKHDFTFFIKVDGSAKAVSECELRIIAIERK
jgi:hypothetical protein